MEEPDLAVLRALGSRGMFPAEADEAGIDRTALGSLVAGGFVEIKTFYLEETTSSDAPPSRPMQRFTLTPAGAKEIGLDPLLIGLA